MNVFLDTNTINEIDLRNNSDLNTVFDYCITYGKKIYLSEVVLLELVHHKKRDVGYISTFMKHWTTKYKSVTGQDMTQIETQMNVEELVRAVFDRAEVETVTNEASDVKRAVESMYLGRKPAKGVPSAKAVRERSLDVITGDAWNGDHHQGGMKDVFIWQAFLHQIKRLPHENFAFITENFTDFTEGQSKKDQCNNFHPHLREDLEANLHRAVCVGSLSAFVRLHVKPIDRFEITDALETLRRDSDIVSDSLAQHDPDTEYSILSIQSINTKRVLDFSTFECGVEAILSSADEEYSASLKLVIAAKEGGYNLINIQVVSLQLHISDPELGAE